jgi:tRNA A37 threonylcarbamoyladenosine modification protein TsaB
VYILSVSTFSLNSSFSLLKKENNNLKTIIEFNLYYNDIDNQSQLSIFPYFFKLVKDKIGINLKDIKQVLILKGPGFFTSLRIGTIISQTIAFINQADLYSIDTFKAILNVFYYFYKEYITPKDNILAIIKVASNKFKLAKLNNFLNNKEDNFITEDLNKNELYQKLKQYSLNNKIILISPNMELEDILELKDILKESGINFIDLRDIFNSSNIAKASFYLNNIQKEDPLLVQLNY